MSATAPPTNQPTVVVTPTCSLQNGEENPSEYDVDQYFSVDDVAPYIAKEPMQVLSMEQREEAEEAAVRSVQEAVAEQQAREEAIVLERQHTAQRQATRNAEIAKLWRLAEEERESARLREDVMAAQRKALINDKKQKAEADRVAREAVEAKRIAEMQRSRQEQDAKHAAALQAELEAEELRCAKETDEEVRRVAIRAAEMQSLYDEAEADRLATEKREAEENADLLRIQENTARAEAHAKLVRLEREEAEAEAARVKRALEEAEAKAKARAEAARLCRLEEEAEAERLGAMSLTVEMPDMMGMQQHSPKVFSPGARNRSFASLAAGHDYDLEPLMDYEPVAQRTVQMGDISNYNEVASSINEEPDPRPLSDWSAVESMVEETWMATPDPPNFVYTNESDEDSEASVGDETRDSFPNDARSSVVDQEEEEEEEEEEQDVDEVPMPVPVPPMAATSAECETAEPDRHIPNAQDMEHINLSTMLVTRRTVPGPHLRSVGQNNSNYAMRTQTWQHVVETLSKILHADQSIKHTPWGILPAKILSLPGFSHKFGRCMTILKTDVHLNMLVKLVHTPMAFVMSMKGRPTEKACELLLLEDGVVVPGWIKNGVPFYGVRQAERKIAIELDHLRNLDLIHTGVVPFFENLPVQRKRLVPYLHVCTQVANANAFLPLRTPTGGLVATSKAAKFRAIKYMYINSLFPIKYMKTMDGLSRISVGGKRSMQTLNCMAQLARIMCLLNIQEPPVMDHMLNASYVCAVMAWGAKSRDVQQVKTSNSATLALAQVEALLRAQGQTMAYVVNGTEMTLALQKCPKKVVPQPVVFQASIPEAELPGRQRSADCHFRGYMHMTPETQELLNHSSDLLRRSCSAIHGSGAAKAIQRSRSQTEKYFSAFMESYEPMYLQAYEPGAKMEVSVDAKGAIHKRVIGRKRAVPETASADTLVKRSKARRTKPKRKSPRTKRL